MGSTLQRSFIKGLVWEVISFIIVILAVYWVYGNLTLSVQFSVILTLVKIPIFFLHERMWKKIKWGKVKD
jgi:adenylylsulfate kinase